MSRARPNACLERPSASAGRGLLARETFHDQVLARSAGRCVMCASKAVDAHHILERKLFPDGGFYLDNGAAVCETHHWDCETTRLSVAEIRRACGITRIVLPPGFTAAHDYDKWGNRLRADGLREPGPLFEDTGCRRALAAGGVLGLFVPKGTP